MWIIIHLTYVLIELNNVEYKRALAVVKSQLLTLAGTTGFSIDLQFTQVAMNDGSWPVSDTHYIVKK